MALLTSLFRLGCTDIYGTLVQERVERYLHIPNTLIRKPTIVAYFRVCVFNPEELVEKFHLEYPDYVRVTINKYEGNVKLESLSDSNPVIFFTDRSYYPVLITEDGYIDKDMNLVLNFPISNIRSAIENNTYVLHSPLQNDSLREFMLTKTYDMNFKPEYYNRVVDCLIDQIPGNPNIIEIIQKHYYPQAMGSSKDRFLSTACSNLSLFVMDETRKLELMSRYVVDMKPETRISIITQSMNFTTLAPQTIEPFWESVKNFPEFPEACMLNMEHLKCHISDTMLSKMLTTTAVYDKSRFESLVLKHCTEISILQYLSLDIVMIKKLKFEVLERLTQKLVSSRPCLSYMNLLLEKLQEWEKL